MTEPMTLEEKAILRGSEAIEAIEAGMRGDPLRMLGDGVGIPGAERPTDDDPLPEWN